MNNLYKYFTPIITECNRGKLNRGLLLGGWILYKKVFNEFDNNLIVVDEYKFSNDLYNPYKYLYNICKKVDYPIILGGDTTVASSSVLSSVNKYRDNLTLIWIDSKPNLNTIISSPTKYTNETTLSLILGYENEAYRYIKEKYNKVRNSKNVSEEEKHFYFSYNDYYRTYLWTKSLYYFLSSTNMIYLGIRDFDDYEEKLIYDVKIKVLETKDIINFIKKTDNKIHITFNINSVDPYYIDSTENNIHNGLEINDVRRVIDISLDEKKLVGLDIVEFNPQLGDIDKSINSMKNIFG